MDQNGFWVTDTNLLFGQSSRHFTFALVAASPGEQLELVPTVLDEVTIDIASMRISELIRPSFSNLSNSQWRRLNQLPQPAPRRSLMAVVKQKVTQVFYDSPLVRCHSMGDLHKDEYAQIRIELIESGFFTRNRDRSVPRDVDMASEALVAGASQIVSNNMNSIYHEDLNKWWIEHEKNPSNESLIFLPSRWVKDVRNLAPEDALVLCAAMVVEIDGSQTRIEALDAIYDLCNPLAARHAPFETAGRDILTAYRDSVEANGGASLVQDATFQAGEPRFVLARQLKQDLDSIVDQENVQELAREATLAMRDNVPQITP